LALRERIDRFFTPRLILIAGWIWFLAYAFPGFVTADSYTQLRQARGDEPLTDWHPPMMSLIWRYTDKLLAGPFAMLTIQSVAFLLGTYLIVRRLVSPRAAAIVAVVFLILPNNIIVMSVVWKDALMAGFLILGLAALLEDRTRWRVVGCVFIFLATAVRYNALAATLPLVVLLWNRDIAIAWYKRFGVGFAVWLGITGSALLVDHLIVDKHAPVFEIGAAPVDIEGILHFAPDVDIDALKRETPDAPWQPGVDVRQVVDKGYKPYNSFHQILDGGPSSIFTYPTSTAQTDALAALWKRLVREHGAAFLRHRLAVAKAQLECRVSVWHATMTNEQAEAISNHRSRLSPTQKVWVRANQIVTSTKPFRPRLYFALSIVLLAFTRGRRLVAALLLSGLANELLLFAIAPSVAYRYSHWMILCVLLSIILLVIERSRASSRLQPN
jgi:hypothetical protein